MLRKNILNIYLIGFSVEIGAFFIFSLKKMYKPDPIIIIIPIKLLASGTSPKTSHPSEIDHNISTYSNGAIDGGEAIR